MNLEKCKEFLKEMNNCYYKIVEFISKGNKNGLYDKIVVYSKLKNFNFSLIGFLYEVVKNEEVKTSRLFSYLVKKSNEMKQELLGIAFDELINYCNNNLIKLETSLVSVSSIYEIIDNSEIKQVK